MKKWTIENRHELKNKLDAFSEGIIDLSKFIKTDLNRSLFFSLCGYLDFLEEEKLIEEYESIYDFNARYLTRGKEFNDFLIDWIDQ